LRAPPLLWRADPNQDLDAQFEASRPSQAGRSKCDYSGSLEQAAERWWLGTCRSFLGLERLDHAVFRPLWLRSDGSCVERGSDGYATGLIALTLEQAGISPENPQLLRALFWLARHQEKQGYWRSSSLNKKRSPSSNAGLFMSDVATA
jgi:hypothetical protein